MRTRTIIPRCVANYILGGGGFASRLTQELREGKGYTYGIRSRIEGGGTDGRFVIESPVRANVTLEFSRNWCGRSSAITGGRSPTPT